MHAVVLLKQILDPELPAGRFRLDPQTRRPPAGLAPEVLGPFERSALEVALQLKDAGAVTRLTALAAGPASFVEGLRKALAVRADEAVLVRVDGELDPAQAAELLARALLRLDGVQLVLAGRQAGDWDHGQVGYLVAERLGWPCVGLVQRASWADGELVVRREGPAGAEVVAVRPPAVLTVTNDDRNVLRMARVQDLMLSRRKPVPEWTPADLGVDAAALAEAAALEVLDVWVPERRQQCERIEGDDPAQVAATLVRRLRELKLL